MIKSAIEQKTIGSLLRDRRREKGLTIEQIAETTKIRSEYLSALENSLYDTFPSEVYLKGFLKNYAKFLGISPDHALALYRRENIVKVTKKKYDFVEKIKDKTSKITITPNKVIVLITGILIISLLIYLSSYFGTILKKPVITITTPISISSEGEFTYTTSDSSVEIAGQLDTNATVMINGQDVSPATIKNFSKTFPVTGESTKFTIVATSPFGRETTIILDVSKVASTDQVSTTPGVTQINASIEVLNNNISLTVFVDGGLKLDKVYDKGTVLELSAAEEIVINTNKASSLTLTINGVQEKMSGTSVTYELSNGKILKN